MLTTLLLLLCATTTSLTMSTTFRTVNRVMVRPSKHWVGDAFNGKYLLLADVAVSSL